MVDPEWSLVRYVLYFKEGSLELHRRESYGSHHDLGHGMKINEAARHTAVLDLIGQLHSLLHPVPWKSELCYSAIHP